MSLWNLATGKAKLLKLQDLWARTLFLFWVCTGPSVMDSWSKTVEPRHYGNANSNHRVD